MTNSTALGCVAQLWRYPVKSLLGEELGELELDARGACGDRVWAVLDPAGKLGSGKDTGRFRRMDGLFELAARSEEGVPVVRFPDGRELRGDDPRVHELLSRHLGISVTLGEESEVSHLDRGPLHILSSASLRWIQAALGDGAADHPRFRPNVVLEVEGEGEGTIEQEWLGSELLLGDEVRLLLHQTTERCRMTGLAQAELPADGRVLKHLARFSAARFGVYGEVLVPGRVRRGDPARLKGPG